MSDATDNPTGWQRGFREDKNPAPDYLAAWELYYILADRRHRAGLTYTELKAVVDAATGGNTDECGL